MNAIKGSCENCGAGFHRVADSGDALMIDGEIGRAHV